MRPRPLGPFFLPVVLPVLGAEPPSNHVPLAANYPREFVGESFFMAYGNLAANNLLSDKRVEPIARYRAARLALLTELREQLSRGRDASTETQRRDLTDLAGKQTPRLLQLEAEAEKIRRELTRVEFFSTPADDIGNLRSTREAPDRSAVMAFLRLVLSAAHFRDGFSPDQRRLLEEMALETILVIEPEPDASSPAAVFFWPAGARIPVPSNLPPAAAAKFEEFQKRKTALKDELRATLNREEKHVFNVDSSEAYAQLAAAQAPRFAKLDAIADQIRPDLVALSDAGSASTAELPADLARQVAAIADRKAALQRELYARLKEFRHDLPADSIELTRQSNGLAITIATENSSHPPRNAVLARINAFNSEISTRFNALASERDALRDAIAHYQATVPGVKPGATVDQLAADFLAAYKAREYRFRQRDYAAAVLTSGLSPAQRRLLLTAANADLLEQPLPSAH